MMQSRLATFVAKLPEREVDAILVSGAENRRYLSGFSGSAGYLFITDERAHLATDFRYTEQATAQSPTLQRRTGPGRLGLAPDPAQGVRREEGRVRGPGHDRRHIQQPDERYR